MTLWYFGIKRNKEEKKSLLVRRQWKSNEIVRKRICFLVSLYSPIRSFSQSEYMVLFSFNVPILDVLQFPHLSVDGWHSGENINCFEIQ